MPRQKCQAIQKDLPLCTRRHREEKETMNVSINDARRIAMG